MTGRRAILCIAARLFRAIAAPALVLGALFPAPAAAWWDLGHETVATIAWDNVRPETRVAVARLLAHADLLDTPTCPAATIEQISTWADCIKTLGPRFSYASSWHYQNVNICRPFDLRGPCANGNCVSAQITRNLALLKDRSLPLRERVMALAFLVHLVGDLHMPLHAGDHDDLGGNRVRAAYGDYAPDRLNLHALWDGFLAERGISTPPSLTRRYSPEERATMEAGTVEDWSRESWQVAHDAYAVAFGHDPCSDTPAPERARLSEEAIESEIPAVRLQIERGGLRLARLLDEALR